MSGPLKPSAARVDLARAEAELMEQREKVAEMRRRLPPEPCNDYVFLEGDQRLVDAVVVSDDLERFRLLARRRMPELDHDETSEAAS